ncbi:hypothetical protein ACP4OV_004675 [Aristida adscensionis]
MARTTAMLVRAAVVAVLLMQCCSVTLAARPLQDAAAEGGAGGWLGLGGAGTLIMQVLNGPGCVNCNGWHGKHPPNCCR